MTSNLLVIGLMSQATPINRPQFQSDSKCFVKFHVQEAQLSLKDRASTLSVESGKMLDGLHL